MIKKHNKNLWEIPVELNHSFSGRGFFYRKRAAKLYLSKMWNDEEFRASFVKRPKSKRISTNIWANVFDIRKTGDKESGNE